MHLTEQQKQKILGWVVILLGVSVMLGQVVETSSSSFRDLISTLRLYVDPVQYMVGMLIINFILVFSAIRRYEQYPNPFLDTLKWYFSVLLINDFLVLLLRVFQKSNLVSLRNNLGFGMGKAYLVLATLRGLTDLTLTSIAVLIMVYGLMRYAPEGSKPLAMRRHLGKAMIGLVTIQWAASIPVNLTMLVSGTLYAWSLGISQAAQVILAASVFWVVKEHHQKYHTRFFRYLTNYYLLTMIITGLVFTYSMGSYGVLQRLPVGESNVIGGFGLLVFYISRGAYIVLNYIMFQAINNYSAPPKHDENITPAFTGGQLPVSGDHIASFPIEGTEG